LAHNLSKEGNKEDGQKAVTVTSVTLSLLVDHDIAARDKITHTALHASHRFAVLYKFAANGGK
jgi:hypothetical protein